MRMWFVSAKIHIDFGRVLELEPLLPSRVPRLRSLPVCPASYWNLSAYYIKRCWGPQECLDGLGGFTLRKVLVWFTQDGLLILRTDYCNNPVFYCSFLSLGTTWWCLLPRAEEAWGPHQMQLPNPNSSASRRSMSLNNHLLFMNGSVPGVLKSNG